MRHGPPSPIVGATNGVTGAFAALAEAQARFREERGVWAGSDDDLELELDARVSVSWERTATGWIATGRHERWHRECTLETGEVTESGEPVCVKLPEPEVGP